MENLRIILKNRYKIWYNIRFDLTSPCAMLDDVLKNMPRVFSASLLIRGQEYQQKGNVLNVRQSDGLLKSRVKGSNGQIYNVHMDLKKWPQKPADCSCPDQTNCKHAVASLLELKQQELNPNANNKESFANHELSAWIQSLQENEQLSTKPIATHQIIYFLQPDPNAYEPRIMVRLALAKILKRGGLGKKTIFNSVNSSRRQHFMADDEEIIAALLFKCDLTNWFDRLPLRNSFLIEKILQTNRAYLFDPESDVPLVLGDAKDAQFVWQLGLDGSQQLQLQATEPEEMQTLLIDRPWYYHAATGVLGHLNTPYSTIQIKKMLAHPPISIQDAPLLAETISKNLPFIPLPKVYEQIEKYKQQPKPIIIFDAVSFTDNEYFFIRDIVFDYHYRKVDADCELSNLIIPHEDALIEICRDLSFEKEIIKKCNELLPVRKTYHWEKLYFDNKISSNILATADNEEEVAYLIDKVKNQLENLGFSIQYNHSIYAPIIYADDLEWFTDLEEKGNDFFNYQLGILVDNKPVSIVPIVADLISHLKNFDIDEMDDDTEILLDLPDGKRLQIDLARIKPLIRFLLHYGTANLNEEKQLVITRYQFILMQETEHAIAATSLRWRGGIELRQHMQKLAGKEQLDQVSLPKNFHTELRDYQYQGLNWLQFLRGSQFGGVLADDMGLGKTIQTLAHLQLEKEQGRLTSASLIVAPTSLVGNWLQETKRFTPDLKMLVFHGSDRHSDSFDDYDVVVSTYGLIQRDKTRFIDYAFYYLILDEAQSIKNARAKTTLIIQQIKARHRLCLSGTPLENHLGELWSLFNFIMPGLLGSTKEFRKFFRVPIEKNADKERQKLLANRVKPFMLRRTKNQVASELPAKTVMTQFIELEGPQRDLYEAIRMSMEKKVRDAISRLGIGKSQIILLDALLKLRQVCCDPRLLSIPEAQIAHSYSAKLAGLMELIDSLMAENRRILLFSQFTSMLKLIEQKLEQRNYSYIQLTGQTQNRQRLVNTFQEGNTPIFLISLKAGGTGLNLTKADTVIHYDPWWNPAVEDQATDRSHRIGQENPVFVYKFIAKGTVEEAMLLMQNKKRQLFEGILSEDTSLASSLTSEDIEQLFMPLTS